MFVLCFFLYLFLEKVLIWAWRYNSAVQCMLCVHKALISNLTILNLYHSYYQFILIQPGGDQTPPPTAPRWVNSGPFSPVPVTKVTASSLSAQVSSFWSSVLGAEPAWTICFCLSWTFNSWLVFVPLLNIATQGPIYSVNKGPRLTESHKMLFFIWVTDFTRKYAPSPESCREVTHCPHVADPTP